MCCNPVVLKKKRQKLLKIAVFGAQFEPIWPNFGVIMCYAQNKKQFPLSKITKADHHFSETFFFYQSIKTFWLSYESFSILWCFVSKKGHFQLTQLWFKVSNFGVAIGMGLKFHTSVASKKVNTKSQNVLETNSCLTKLQRKNW